MQALQNSQGHYYLWTRYGRVGSDGVGTNAQCHSKEILI